MPSNCPYHKRKKAEYICPDCGKNVCRECTVIKRGIRGATPMIKCAPCYYKFLMKGTKVLLVLGIILSIPLLIAPSYLPLAYLNFILYRVGIGPVFGLGLGNILANYFSIRLFQRLNIPFASARETKKNIVFAGVLLATFIAIHLRNAKFIFPSPSGEFAILLFLFLFGFGIGFPLLTPTFRLR